jgi:RecJ-like exonuclease
MGAKSYAEALAAFGAAQEAYKAAEEVFAKEYPQYCRRCNATGVVTTIESHEFWGARGTVAVKDVCPSCAEQGLCPLCGLTMQEDANGEERCLACGWTTARLGETQGPEAPHAPEPESYLSFDFDAPPVGE